MSVPLQPFVRPSESFGISKTGNNRNLPFDERWLFDSMTGEADVIHQLEISNAIHEVVVTDDRRDPQIVEHAMTVILTDCPFAEAHRIALVRLLSGKGNPTPNIA